MKNRIRKRKHLLRNLQTTNEVRLEIDFLKSENLSEHEYKDEFDKMFTNLIGYEACDTFVKLINTEPGAYYSFYGYFGIMLNWQRVKGFTRTLLTVYWSMRNGRVFTSKDEFERLLHWGYQGLTNNLTLPDDNEILKERLKQRIFFYFGLFKQLRLRIHESNINKQKREKNNNS